METIRTLLRIKLPNEITDEFIDQILQYSVLLKIRKGEKLIIEGEKKRSVYLILAGSFVRTVITNAGELKTIMFHSASFQYFMTPIDSFLIGKKTQFSLTANEKSQVLEIPYQFIQDSIETSSRFYKFYTNYIEASYLLAEQFKIMYLTLKTDQYLEWLYMNHRHLFLTFPSASIASFMDITPVWFSKLKRKLIS